jgi:hypothetical protein
MEATTAVRLQTASWLAADKPAPCRKKAAAGAFLRLHNAPLEDRRIQAVASPNLQSGRLSIRARTRIQPLITGRATRSSGNFA